MTVMDPFGIIRADVVTPRVIEPGKIVGLGPTGAIRAGRDPIVAEWMRKRVAADLAGRRRRHKRDQTAVWGYGQSSWMDDSPRYAEIRKITRARGFRI